jgi:hypothetical protein
MTFPVPRRSRPFAFAGTRAALAGLFLTSLLPAANTWIKLKSRHFELYSSNSPKKSARLLGELERVRGVFVAETLTPVSAFRVRIVAFSSRAEYVPYAANPYAAGYFLPGHHRDYIVLQDLQAEHMPVALHEYAHFALAQRGAAFPLWLDEGLAEVYSTVKEEDGATVIGTPPVARLATLQRSGLVDLGSLFAFGRRPKECAKSPAQLALFYSQSWALAHMLKFSSAYSDGFARFLALLGEGKSVEDSLKEVYGKTLVAATTDLLHYVAEASPRSYRASNRNATPHWAIEMEQPSSVELNTVMGDLLATLQHFDVARPMLEKLAAEHPHTPQVEEALAYLFLRQNNVPEAEWYFSLAAADGDDNPRLWYHHARTMLAMGMSSSAVAPVLRRALVLDPTYSDAQEQLASILPSVAKLEPAAGNPAQSANIKGLR